jgi:hypothetical protein
MDELWLTFGALSLRLRGPEAPHEQAASHADGDLAM